MVVIAEADNGRDAIDLAAHFRPDVVVMDIVMANVDGLSATRAIVARNPDVRVLLLTASEDLELGIVGLRAGAAGHLIKGRPLTELVAAVQRIAAGEPVVGPELTWRLIESVRALPAGGLGVRPVRSKLTPREWEVLDLLCAGLSVDQISDELVLARDTVRTHVKRVAPEAGGAFAGGGDHDRQLDPRDVHRRRQRARKLSAPRVSPTGMTIAERPMVRPGCRRDPRGHAWLQRPRACSTTPTTGR